MSDTKLLTKTPMQILKQDHRIMKDLFAEYAKLGEDDAEEKERLWQQINEELTIHTEIEERLFYPAVRDVKTDEAEDLINEAVEEHHVMKTLLEELSDKDVGDESFDSKLKALRDHAEHHFDEEEKEIFAEAQKLPKEVLESLTIEMESLKNDLEDKDVE